MKQILYIFLDEGGNLDFSLKGTKYFTLSGVSKFRPFEAFKDLHNLKYDLIEHGFEFEYFHAAEDKQMARDEVFKVINEKYHDSFIDSLIIEKRKTEPALQDEEKFYTKMFGYLVNYVINRYDFDTLEGIVITTDNLPLKKKKKAVEKGLKTMLASQLKGKIPYTILHHQSKSNYDLQMADYCNWAIFRKWERNDSRSYDLIKKYIRSEFDIFATGERLYY